VCYYPGALTLFERLTPARPEVQGPGLKTDVHKPPHPADCSIRTAAAAAAAAAAAPQQQPANFLPTCCTSYFLNCGFSSKKKNFIRRGSSLKHTSILRLQFFFIYLKIKTEALPYSIMLRDAGQ